MLASVLTRACLGTDAPKVCVEVYLSTGLPAMRIVGLAEGAVRESQDRVRSALATSGFEFPAGRIVVSLAPADLPKSGGRYDLPIALGILAASAQIPIDGMRECEFYGELSLDGTLQPFRGALPAVCQAVKARHRVVLPRANLAEGCLVAGARVAGAGHLLEVCAHVKRSKPLQFVLSSGNTGSTPTVVYPDLADVRGQVTARRAIEIAAAGAHNVLLMGPMGTGKSMLAHRFPGILPRMSSAEARETAAIASVGEHGFRVCNWGVRPVRSPHHTTPALAMTGGGVHPKPGEVSLAHNGVMFLDELPYFKTEVLEALREPLEIGAICISRTARQTTFPARFQLIAAMNNCPCGRWGDGTQRCRCSDSELHRYRSRVSGPLLDRLDMHIRTTRVNADALHGLAQRGESSVCVAARVLRARQRQLARQQACNAHLDSEAVGRYCALDVDGMDILQKFVRSADISARAYERIVRVARTVADLDSMETIAAVHVAEALMFRQLELGPNS